MGAYEFDPLVVVVDIKPGSCPNPLGVKKKEDFPAAILGTDELHVTDIDPGSVMLAGVPLLRYSREDVATPFEGSVGDGASCLDCTRLRKDGHLDLTLKFDTQAIVAALQAQLGRSLVHNECLVLTLEGELWDGTPFLGRDVVTVKVE